LLGGECGCGDVVTQEKYKMKSRQADMDGLLLDRVASTNVIDRAET
jgi:hypothetical protein